MFFHPFWVSHASYYIQQVLYPFITSLFSTFNHSLLSYLLPIHLCFSMHTLSLIILLLRFHSVLVLRNTNFSWASKFHQLLVLSLVPLPSFDFPIFGAYQPGFLLSRRLISFVPLGRPTGRFAGCIDWRLWLWVESWPSKKSKGSKYFKLSVQKQ